MATKRPTTRKTPIPVSKARAQMIHERELKRLDARERRVRQLASQLRRTRVATANALTDLVFELAKEFNIITLAPLEPVEGNRQDANKQ